MEWPPRKFHPNRFGPDKIFDGSVLEARARKKGMLRELRNLGVAIITQQAWDAVAQVHDDGAPGGYIEEVPPADKMWRRQNMVHFDIDPSNSNVAFPSLAPPFVFVL